MENSRMTRAYVYNSIEIQKINILKMYPHLNGDIYEKSPESKERTPYEKKKNEFFDLCFERERQHGWWILIFNKTVLNECVRFYFVLEYKIFAEYYMQFKRKDKFANFKFSWMISKAS